MNPITCFALFIALFVGSTAHASTHATELPPWRWKEGFWRLSARTSYFSSNANYDDSRGTYENLPGDNRFETIDLELRARYNLSRRFSLYGGADVVSATSQDATLTRNKSTLSDLNLGFNYLLFQKGIRLVAEVEGSFAVDSINPDTSNVMTSDGVHFLRTSLFMFKPFHWFNTFAHTGFKYRDEGLAALFLWDIGVEKPFAGKFLVGAGLEGYESVIGDELTAAQREMVTNRVNAGSGTFYAYNPALIEGSVWAGWNPINAWQLRLGYMQTINGVRAAAGQTVFLNVSYNFEPKPDRESFQYYRTRQREAIRKKSKKALEGFEVEPDTSDPTLFDEDDGFEPDVDHTP